MKGVCFLVLLLSTCLYGNGQKAFRNISYAQAISLANAENKLIFLQVYYDGYEEGSDVSDIAFDDKKLYKTITKNYIGLKVLASNPDWTQIARDVNMEKPAGTFYIDKQGRLVHHSNKYHRDPTYYRDEMKVARGKLNQLLQVDTDEAGYFNQGRKDIDLLKRIIQNKNDLGQEVGLLLTEYLQLLPADSVNTATNLQFIARQAPILGTEPDVLMRNSALFDKAWFAMPLDERISINRRIIGKSLKMAVQEQDENRAEMTADFARRINDNRGAQTDSYEWNMMEFYRCTNNYTKYFPLALGYYNRYAARIDLRILDSIDRAGLRAADIAGAKVYKPVKQVYVNRLNRAVSGFLRLDKDAKYIDYTLAWMNRSMALNNRGSHQKYLYAKVMYQKGDRIEAVRLVTEAIGERKIEMRKEKPALMKRSVMAMETILQKMKSGLPLDAATA